MCYNQNTKGFVTLFSVLIVSAVAIAVTISTLLLGMSRSQTSFAQEQSYQAKALASACAEEALEQIRDHTPFTGSGRLSLGQGICTYTVTNPGGQNRIVTATGTVGSLVRKIKIIINTLHPSLGITSWQEVDEFE